MPQTRSTFLKTLGLSASALMLAPLASESSPRHMDLSQSTGLRLGLASYTLRSFKLDDVIKISKRLGLNSIALKSMHLPLEASADELKAMADKVREAGIRLYGAGVIYMKTEQEVETIFNYAAAAQLEMIIGVPNHELLPLVNEKVKATNIKLAIHNHGPGDTLYSSPNDVYTKIKDLDKRIGFCIDVGHVIRIGQDPIAFIEKHKDRLYDLHIKDVDKAVADGTPVEIGRGIIPIPKVIKTLKKINYQGAVAIEYEKDGEDPVPGLAESVGYLRGVIALS
jgi:sugar phosphate isomerase/epimerase